MKYSLIFLMAMMAFNSYADFNVSLIPSKVYVDSSALVPPDNDIAPSPINEFTQKGSLLKMTDLAGKIPNSFGGAIQTIMAFSFKQPDGYTMVRFVMGTKAFSNISVYNHESSSFIKHDFGNNFITFEADSGSSYTVFIDAKIKGQINASTPSVVLNSILESDNTEANWPISVEALSGDEDVAPTLAAGFPFWQHLDENQKALDMSEYDKGAIMRLSNIKYPTVTDGTLSFIKDISDRSYREHIQSGPARIFGQSESSATITLDIALPINRRGIVQVGLRNAGAQHGDQHISLFESEGIYRPLPTRGYPGFMLASFKIAEPGIYSIRISRKISNQSGANQRVYLQLPGEKRLRLLDLNESVVKKQKSRQAIEMHGFTLGDLTVEKMNKAKPLHIIKSIESFTLKPNPEIVQ